MHIGLTQRLLGRCMSQVTESSVLGAVRVLHVFPHFIITIIISVIITIVGITFIIAIVVIIFIIIFIIINIIIR